MKPLDNLTPPIFYDHGNVALTQQQPGTIHCADNNLSRFFARYLLQRIMSVYDFKLPDAWAANYFLYTLFCIGYVAVIRTDKYGVVPQNCGLYGYNVMYQPTHAIISNQLLRGNLRPQIGKQCTIIRLQPDYGSVWDLVSYYANLMACAAQGATANLINSKFSYVFFADGRADAETFKALFDNLSNGQPASVVDKRLLNENGEPRWTMFTQNVGQNYIADKIIATMRRISEMFDTEIGIPNANEDKKERMVTDEVNANNIETYSRASMWLDELKKSCKQTADLFDIKISVDWRKYNPAVLPGVGGGADRANNGRPDNNL